MIWLETHLHSSSFDFACYLFSGPYRVVLLSRLFPLLRSLVEISGPSLSNSLLFGHYSHSMFLDYSFNLVRRGVSHCAVLIHLLFFIVLDIFVSGFCNLALEGRWLIKRCWGCLFDIVNSDMQGASLDGSEGLIAGWPVLIVKMLSRLLDKRPVFVGEIIFLPWRKPFFDHWDIIFVGLWGHELLEQFWILIKLVVICHLINTKLSDYQVITLLPDPTISEFLSCFQSSVTWSSSAFSRPHRTISYLPGWWYGNVVNLRQERSKVQGQWVHLWDNQRSNLEWVYSKHH